MKKILFSFMLFLSALLIVACDEVVEEPVEITLSANTTLINLKEGETFELVVTTNDEEGYTASVLDEEIASLDDLVVTGLKQGQTKIRIESVTDEAVFLEITLNVTKVIAISLSDIEGVIWVGQSIELVYEANDDVTFESSDESIAIVDENGLVEFVGAGTVTLTIKSVLDPEVTDSIEVTVFSLAEEIVLVGNTKANIGTNRQLLVSFAPVTAVSGVSFTVDDETLATITEEGLITFLKTGKVKVTATYELNPELMAELEIDIFDIVYLDASVQSGSIEHEGLDFVFGERLFNKFADLDSVLNEETEVIVAAGTYNDSFTITSNFNLTKLGVTKFGGLITIDGPNLTISGFEFVENGGILAKPSATNLSIVSNKFEGLAEDAIVIEEANGLTIHQNEFINLSKDGIKVLDFKTGDITILKNKFNQAGLAISILGEAYQSNSKLSIQRNELQNVKTGFSIILGEQQISAIVRFNSLASFSEEAAIANRDYVDFTLNHWGSAELDLNDFEGIPERMLLGHYKQKNNIPSEASYNPAVPQFIFITNPVEEVFIGSTFKLEWDYLPYELTGARFRLITTDSDILMPNDNGILTPKRSGLATITVRSANVATINTVITISVTTDPGIDIIPSHKEQNLVVGDKVTLEAVPFPYTLANEVVTYESLNTNIATVTENGEVTGLQAGDVIIRVRLQSDPSVYSDYTVQFFESLNQDNLLDLLTVYQVGYTQEYRYDVIGTGMTFKNVDYESVSKYYFDNDIEVNTSKMVPVSNGIRPGIKKPAHPAGITTYNPQNVYWLTIHDTANNAPGSGALSHANYLYNAAMAGTVLNTSWTYTMDDEYLYQHVPEDEVSYHAGDGSTLPGQSATYLGGGNRNGIAIEMSVAQDDDIYRVWQRTAKFATQRMVYYNLPRGHLRFHRDFSGKICPNTLINSGLVSYFQEFADVEYQVWKDFANATIGMTSHNPEILDDHGRIIAKPDHATTISYTVYVEYMDQSMSRTFFVHVPGTIR